jgi:hypothetical protein
MRDASMNELESYLAWVITRLDTDEQPREEPDLEFKSAYKQGQSEAESTWELADLLAALSNDTRLDGYRALVFGPASTLQRPGWLSDESVLRNKLLRHFDGGALPGVELIRREISGRGEFDAFVILERDSTPYVTRLTLGGEWGVRVRTNTARRTATRAELLALSGGRPPSTQPVRQLDARVAPLGKGTRKIVVTNVGTIPIRDIHLETQEDAETRVFGPGEGTIALLNPSERDNIPIIGFDMLNERTSERVNIVGTADDGERVEKSLLISSFD